MKVQYQGRHKTTDSLLHALLIGAVAALMLNGCSTTNEDIKRTDQFADWPARGEKDTDDGNQIRTLDNFPSLVSDHRPYAAGRVSQC